MVSSPDFYFEKLRHLTSKKLLFLLTHGSARVNNLQVFECYILYTNILILYTTIEIYDDGSVQLLIFQK